jgi:hypothetical protein
MLAMTRFYSDENFPLELVKQLRQWGYEVLTAYEAGQANQAIDFESGLCGTGVFKKLN